ncbi:hypothetical protein C7401_1012 [Paraburkholderia unamae]|uniref:HutD/Ves family protein n=1 Tax=Paraburkholderia unamae TaxID=219649 RepID=UPI000DC364E2|nr:HutD family protein [Paraburkholderia unamae]RAR67764.1 hypothetical protein C7401_1012 [Paraburkholderia unamae]
MSPLPDTGATLTLLRGADLAPSAWKNGGGVTREIAARAAAGASPDGFAWRVSLADIERAGPFSRFEGIERTLVLINGAGLLLDETNAERREPRLTHALERVLDVARFAGESSVDARLIAGPVRVFNLMVRTGAARGALDVWPRGGQRSACARTVLVHAVQGPVDVSVDGGDAIALAPGDTLQVEARQAVDIASRGDGALLVATLDLVQA